MWNEFVSGATFYSHVTWEVVSIDLWNRMLDILHAPFEITNMLWMLLPILTTLVLMEFYFGRYKEEDLGWNTAYGNALVLIFVAIDLFRNVFEPLNIPLWTIFSVDQPKIYLAIGLFAFAILLMLIDFFHFLPERVAYVISSPGYVNTIAALFIIITYSRGIPLDLLTLLACLVIFIVANILSMFLYLIIPGYKAPLQRILTVHDLEKFRKQSKKEK